MIRESFGMNLRERRKQPASASPSEEELDEVIAKLEKEDDLAEEQRNKDRPSRKAKENCRRTIDLSNSEASASSPSPSEEEEESEEESEGPDLEGGSIVARTMKGDELWLLIKPKDEAWNKVLWAPYQVCCEEDSAYKQRYASFKRKHRESEGMHAVDFVACKKERSNSGDGSSTHPTTGRPSRASLAGASVIDMPQKELLEVLVDREIINEEWLVPDHLLTFSKVEGSRIWLVQWGGLPVSEATWEDESPTDTPQELIEEWEKLNDPSRKHRWKEIADNYLASHQDCDDDIRSKKRRGRPPKHKKQKAMPLGEIKRPKDIAENWVAEKLCAVASYTPTPTPGGEEVKPEEKSSEEMEADSDEMVYLPTKDTLFGFQVEGIQWLLHNWSQYRGCILADEMGMGKTVQTAVFLSAVMGTVGGTGPCLIIAPLSTLQHWQRELQKWAPELKVVVMAGSSEDRDMIADFDMSWINPNTGHREKEPMKHRAEPEFCPKFDVVVTSYEIFLTCSSRSGLTSLTNYNWRVVVLDEGHRVKNHLSHSTKALTHIINVQHTVILTGTPIQNNLKELWSILHLVDKKRFPTYEEVEAELRKDESEEEESSKEGTSTEQDKKSEHDSAAANLDLDKVTEVLRPYMLRRYKSDAMKKVPPKLEHIIEVEFTTLQRKVYKSVYDKKIYSLVRGKGGKSMLNNIAMELRKCCAHPYLISGVEESHLEALGVEPDSNVAMQNLTEMSGKFVFLEKLIPQLREKGEKLLIFSQFKIVLDIIEDWLTWKKLPVERLDGSVSGPKRQAVIDRFNDKKHDSFAFLLTTRAGGVGINLTSASVVVIYDSDWNPQNDNQAQARCHRIGQTKTVRVYRLLTRDSYEQKLFEIASKKLGLEQAIMSSVTANSDLNLSKKELESLIKDGAYAAFKDNSSREEEFRNASLDDIMSSDRIKTVTYGTMVSGGHRSRFSKAYFSANPGTPKTEDTVSSPESVESGGGEGTDINLSDVEFWSKLVPDKSLLTTDPDAKEEIESMDVGTRSSRKTRYAGNFLRFRTARTEKDDRFDQEYEPAESVSEFGESDLDEEDLVDEEESLSKASRGKKRGKRKTKNEVDAHNHTGAASSTNESVRPPKRPRVDISSASPALQRAAAAAAAAQKAKAAAAAAAASGVRRPPSPGMSYPYMPQHQGANPFPVMGVSSATYPYIPPPPRFPYSAVQYRAMPMPPGSIGNNVPNSRMLFPPPAMYQSSANYGMMYGMYVASRAAASSSGERHAHQRREPPVNPEDLIGSIDSNNIERLD